LSFSKFIISPKIQLVANDYSKNWTTGEELRFINSLSVRGLEGYKQAFSLRGRWGSIKKSKVERFLRSKV